MRTTTLDVLGTSLLVALSMSCGEPATSRQPADTLVTGIRLGLSTVGASGTEYRLTRGTFTITGGIDWETGEPLVRTLHIDDHPDATLEVPVDPEYYEVKLEDGWELSKSLDGSPLEVVEATLLDNPQFTYVEQYRESLVTFPFILGESEIKLGISVDENGSLTVPDGYDGIILPVGDGRFHVEFAGGGGACCFASPDDARESYPGHELYYDGAE